MVRFAARGFGMLMTMALLATGVAAPAAASVSFPITVNTLSDTVADDGFCSLREALTASNTNLPSGATAGECATGNPAGAEDIGFSVHGTITLGSSMVSTGSAVYVRGDHGITIEANGFRAFDLSGDFADIEDLAIHGGDSPYGGAVATTARTYFTNVTISGSTSNYGGAVYVGAGGLATFTGVTLAGNTATIQGGGIYSAGADLELFNSTVAGNSAQAGGGIYSQADKTLFHHITVSGNTAPDGGGARVSGGVFLLTNSLIVGNSSNNLVATGTALTRKGSTINRSATGVLDPSGLQRNGGFTKTIRLVDSTTNPAIGHGDPEFCAGLTTDQRGAPRAAPCDDGAVELDRSHPKIVVTPKTSFLSGSTAGNTTMKVTVAWEGTDTGSGIDRYQIQRQVNGGSWSTLSSNVTPTGFAAGKGSYTTSLSSGKSYRFRVRARDEDGNWSAWSYGVTVGARLVQQSSSAVVFSTGWSTSTSSSYSGGSAKHSASPGKAVRYTFTGRAIAFVSTYRAPFDSFRVYIDGALQGTYAVASLQNQYRRQVWTKRFSSSATHTIRIVVASGRVDVDAFEVLK